MATFNFIPDYLMAEVYFPTQILRSKSLVVPTFEGEILIGNIVWFSYVRILDYSMTSLGSSYN